MLRTLVISTILVAGLSAGVANRFAALVFYVWFALFRPIEWMWIDLSQLRLSLVAGLLLVVPCLATGLLPNISHPMSVGMLAFAAAAAVAHVGAVAPDVSFAWLDYFIRLTLTCLLTVTLVTDRRRFVILFAVIAGSFGFHSAKAGLASLLGGGVRFFDGLAGAFVDNNGYAVGAAVIVFLLIGTAQHAKRRWAKAGWFILAPLSAVMIVSTFSRGGFLALAGGAVVFVALQKHRLRAAAAAGVLLLVSSVVFTPPQGWSDRIATIQTYEEVGETSAIGRLHFWRVAVDMATANPLGVGLFNYEANYDRFDFSGGEFGTRRSVHSSHFQTLAETGLIGTAAYCFLFGYAVILLFRIRSRSRVSHLSVEDSRFLTTTSNSLIAAIVAFLVGGSFIAMALNDLTWLMFALVAALDRISLQMADAPARNAAAAPAIAIPAALPGAWAART